MEGNETLFDLQVDDPIKQHLSDAAKWAKFLSITGFVFCGLIFLGSLFAIVTLSGASDTAALGATQLILLLVFMLLYILPLIFLFNFARNMLAALRQSDQLALTTSFRNLKMCYKYLGILTIVLLGIYALAFIVGLMAGASI